MNKTTTIRNICHILMHVWSRMVAIGGCCWVHGYTRNFIQNTHVTHRVPKVLVRYFYCKIKRLYSHAHVCWWIRWMLDSVDVGVWNVIFLVVVVDRNVIFIVFVVDRNVIFLVVVIDRNVWYVVCCLLFVWSVVCYLSDTRTM